MLLDGKASKHREKYVDSEQLIWYAVQHYLTYHIAPTKLGFVFWCFPEDPVKWVVYDNRAIRDSLDKTFEVAKVSAECKRCDFISRCEDGQKFAQKNKVDPADRIDNSVFEIEPA